MSAIQEPRTTCETTTNEQPSVYRPICITPACSLVIAHRSGSRTFQPHLSVTYTALFSNKQTTCTAQRLISGLPQVINLQNLKFEEPTFDEELLRTKDSTAPLFTIGVRIAHPLGDETCYLSPVAFTITKAILNDFNVIIVDGNRANLYYNRTMICFFQM